MAKKNKLITIAVAIVIAIVSFTVVGAWASKTETYEKSIKALDETKTTALELSACATTAATMLAFVPGDATTPIANKFMDVVGYTVIVFTAIVFEKYLMTLTGMLAFKILIPIACVLIVLACIASSEDKRRAGYRFAARIAILGLLLWSLVPVSIKVSDCIKGAYQDNIEVSVDSEEIEEKAEIDQTADVKKESVSSSKTLMGKAKVLLNNAKADVTTITENSKKKISKKVNEFKTLLDELFEKLAIMIVTTCVIPICVLLLGLWLVKMVLGVSVSMPRMPKASNILKKSSEEVVKE